MIGIIHKTTMAVLTMIYVLTLFTLVKSTWIVCGSPGLCYCSTDHTQVYCIGSQVNVLPMFLKVTYRSAHTFTIKQTNIRSIHLLDLTKWKSIQHLEIIGNKYIINCENEKKRLFNEGIGVPFMNIECFEHNENTDTTVQNEYETIIQYNASLTPNAADTTVQNEYVTTIQYNASLTPTNTTSLNSIIWLSWTLPVVFIIFCGCAYGVYFLCKNHRKVESVTLANSIYLPTTTNI